MNKIDNNRTKSRIELDLCKLKVYTMGIAGGIGPLEQVKDLK